MNRWDISRKECLFSLFSTMQMKLVLAALRKHDKRVIQTLQRRKHQEKRKEILESLYHGDSHSQKSHHVSTIRSSSGLHANNTVWPNLNSCHSQ